MFHWPSSWQIGEVQWGCGIMVWKYFNEIFIKSFSWNIWSVKFKGYTIWVFFPLTTIAYFKHLWHYVTSFMCALIGVSHKCRLVDHSLLKCQPKALGRGWGVHFRTKKWHGQLDSNAAPHCVWQNVITNYVCKLLTMPHLYYTPDSALQVYSYQRGNCSCTLWVGWSHVQPWKFLQGWSTLSHYQT